MLAWAWATSAVVHLLGINSGYGKHLPRAQQRPAERRQQEVEELGEEEEHAPMLASRP